jgi:SH3-like domain-containing protein
MPLTERRLPRSGIRLALPLVLVLVLVPVPARAEEREVPYWASLTANKVNMRVGPARHYRIDWVFRRDGLPVKVVRLHEGWRLIEDPVGSRGWVLSRFLSRARAALVTGRIAELREQPGAGGRVLWRLERGVVGLLGECADGWCKLDVHGRKGWVDASSVWGDGEP